MRSLPVPFSPSSRMVVASLAATRRTKFITSRMQGDSAMTSRFCGRGLLGDVLDGGDHAGQACPSSSNIWLVRITTSRSMPLSVCRRTVVLACRQGLVQTHQHAAVRVRKREHWKISWQCFPSISSLDMPKSFSAARFTPVMRNSGSYRTRASESWSNTDSRTLVLCQPGVSLDICLKLESDYSKPDA